MVSQLSSHYIPFCAVGRIDEVSLSDESIGSHDLDGNGDVLPPPLKNIHMTTQTNEAQERFITRE